MKLKYSLRFSVFILIMTFVVFESYSQNPDITVRFANPHFDIENLTYTLDVEFQSDTELQQLFGMNVRLFYDDDLLEFSSFGDFQGGYGPIAPSPPVITTAPASTAALFFTLDGEVDFINGAIQFVNTSATPIYISTTSWTKLFNVSFNVDPYAFSSSKFFPSVIWDLEEIEGKGGFLTGDDGVVISLLSDDFDSESVPANEKVSHHNWHYDGLAGYPYGYPGVNTPVAVDDFISTTKDVPVRINVIVNDYHLDGIINPYSLEKGTYENNLLMPTNGKVKIDKQTGEMTYFPHSGFSGIDTYEYEICDNEGLCDIGLVTISVISDISASVDNKDIGLDDKLSPAVLYQNLPNPFNNTTIIKFYIPESTLVTLSVYDAVGELIEEMVNVNMDEGEYEFELSAENYRVGTYFYKLTTNETVIMKPMNVIK